jgi:hypothetical protein
MIVVSKLTNKELCQITDILKKCEKIQYSRINERISGLKELEQFGEQFVNWVVGVDIDNVYQRMLFLTININCEMSERFYQLNLVD